MEGSSAKNVKAELMGPEPSPNVSSPIWIIGGILRPEFSKIPMKATRPTSRGRGHNDGVRYRPTICVPEVLSELKFIPGLFTGVRHGESSPSHFFGPIKTLAFIGSRPRLWFVFIGVNYGGVGPLFECLNPICMVSAWVRAVINFFIGFFPCFGTHQRVRFHLR